MCTCKLISVELLQLNKLLFILNTLYEITTSSYSGKTARKSLCEQQTTKRIGTEASASLPKKLKKQIQKIYKTNDRY